MKDRPANESPTGFESSIPFRPLRVRTAAVYCSDGRFGEQIDEFLNHLLGSALCDRLALPGGPASLRADSGLPDDSTGTFDQLSFLVRVHEVQQVILIAHEPCAFYRERLGVPDEEQHDRQVEDLREASRIVGMLAPTTVDLYTAQLVGDRVRFRAVIS